MPVYVGKNGVTFLMCDHRVGVDNVVKTTDCIKTFVNGTLHTVYEARSFDVVWTDINKVSVDSLSFSLSGNTSNTPTTKKTFLSDFQIKKDDTITLYGSVYTTNVDCGQSFYCDMYSTDSPNCLGEYSSTFNSGTSSNNFSFTANKIPVEGKLKVNMLIEGGFVGTVTIYISSITVNGRELSF